MTTLLGSAPFYAGSVLTLRCGAEIDAAVDVPYSVAVMWTRSGAALGSSDRVTLSNVTQLSPYTYEASLSINPLSSTSDTGTYACQMRVNPDPPLQGASQSDMETISVQGIYSCVHRIESPLSFLSWDLTNQLCSR